MNHKIGDWEQVVRNSNEIFKTLTTSTDQYGWRGGRKGDKKQKMRSGEIPRNNEGKKKHMVVDKYMQSLIIKETAN